MRAARLVAAPTDGRADVRVQELDPLDPSPLQVLVDVRACGVCGSDLALPTGGAAADLLPVTIGHEAAGVITDVGAEVEGWRPGDRVVLHATWACGGCGYCRANRQNLCRHRSIPGRDVDGFQATQALADPRFVSPLPGDIDFAEAAVLVDAAAAPYHALKRVGIGEGVVCAVYGLGGLGLHAVQLARLAGASVIGVDVHELPLQRGLDWGAGEVLDAREGPPHERIAALTGGGVDCALEFTGAVGAIDQAVRSVKPGGRVAVTALSAQTPVLPPVSSLVTREIELVGSFGATGQDVGELLDLVEAGRLDLSRSVTHRIDLDEVPEALRWLQTREQRPVRAVATHPDTAAPESG